MTGAAGGLEAADGQQPGVSPEGCAEREGPLSRKGSYVQMRVILRRGEKYRRPHRRFEQKPLNTRQCQALPISAPTRPTTQEARGRGLRAVLAGADDIDIGHGLDHIRTRTQESTRSIQRESLTFDRRSSVNSSPPGTKSMTMYRFDAS